MSLAALQAEGYVALGVDGPRRIPGDFPSMAVGFDDIELLSS